MSDKYIILSDLHMGRQPWRATADMLRPLWQGGQHLIINGDVAELDDPRYCDLAHKETLRLQELCEQDGLTLTLLAGNHDPNVSDAHFAYLADGAILITHGDSIHPAIAPWCLTAPLMREAFDRAMASFPTETRDRLTTRLAATKEAARAKWSHLKQNNFHQMGMKRMIWRPWSFFQVMWYWAKFPWDAARFLEQYSPHSQVLITGHTHHQGMWQRRGKTIINTGGFAFPAKPWRVVVEARHVTTQAAVKDGATYRLIEKPVAEFDVEPTPVASVDAE